MHSVEPRSDERQEIAAIEVREALSRHRKRIEPEDGGKHPAIHPKRQAASPEEAKKQRDQDDAGAGDKPRLGRGSVLEPSGLESVASEHEEAESGARETTLPY